MNNLRLQSSIVDPAMAHLLSLQNTTGCWEGEMLWCPVVTAQVVIARHVIGTPFPASEADGILRHFEYSQNRNGAFGLHPEHAGSVFVTTIVYVAARLLGCPADHPIAAKARNWLSTESSGVTAIPTWGKFWLSLLGLYSRDGLRPLVPELVLLPSTIPVHPIRLYCHTRYIYLAMSLLQGGRIQFDLGATGQHLIRELYSSEQLPNNLRQHRYHLASEDAFEKPSLLIRTAERFLGWYDSRPIQRVRDRALRTCEALITRELAATDYMTVSPVNGTLNAMALFARGASSAEIGKCVSGFDYYRWDDPERGLRFAGGRTRIWDTSFAVEAILANPRTAVEHHDALLQAHHFLASQQMTHSVRDRDPLFPDTAIGGWCLGDAKHAWPVSDCTAEAVAALIGIQELLATSTPVSNERLAQAADFILSRQNRDGGFGSYERARAPLWLEQLNPSEMFTRCMTDQSYVECTGSSLVALARLRKVLPGGRSTRLLRAIRRGVRFLLSQQRADGAFAGSWGIYLTYGTFHAVRGLCASGYQGPALERAARWLLTHQKADGGWGEHYTSCLRGEYVEHPESQAPQTSWALLALAECVGEDHNDIRRGVNWLLKSRSSDGSWPRAAVNGVFFGTAMLEYDLYRIYFPVWALNLLMGGTGA